jgi:hypothetical protein
MSQLCPWCREPLRRTERSSELCPHCGRPRVEGGRELRPVDLRYQEVEAGQWTIYRQLMIWGSASAALVFLVLPLIVPIAAPPLVLVAHLLVVRIWLTRRARALLSGTRRFFVRWISRLAFLWLGGLGYGLSAVPLVGVLLGAGVFAGLTTAVHYYTLWSLECELQRRPLALWEKLTLLGLVLLTMLLILVVAGLALALGWSIAKLVELLGGR